MSPSRVDLVVDGYWTWVGDYVIGPEPDWTAPDGSKGRYVAIHKQGTTQLNAPWGGDRVAAARQLVARCLPRER